MTITHVGSKSREVLVFLFKCIFNLGPLAVNMLQASRYLNPALVYSDAVVF